MGVITFNEFKGPRKEKNQSEILSVPEKTSEYDIEKSVENTTLIESKLNEEKFSITEHVEEISGYKLYRDKQENFCCEVGIEGARLESSSVRLIIESPEWNLLFNGTIEKNGKCTIPIKKLPILSEGTTGIIKLEVIAEDTVFIPWEEEFTVKSSKKVSVKVMEQDKYDKPEIKFNKL